jgi:DNA-binding transcriptional ArsR family regulator
MNPDDLDATLFALASEPRRRMLDWLVQEPGCNVNRLTERFEGELSRFGVMKHLQVLERGQLVVSLKEGRERLLWFNPVPIQLIHERWTTQYSAYWAAKLTKLKVAAEGAEILPLPPPKKKGRPR